MGVVELLEGAIVELELSINKKPMNMRSKMLKEAELVKQITKINIYIAATDVVT